MPVKLFFCYAREDEPLLNKLKSHLSPLQRQGIIEMWHDRDISAGTEWESEIKEHLNKAQIILLLISPDFMNSEYCYGIELQRAIERHKRRETRVIPIILRPVYWQGEPLGTLQALPTDAKPVTDPGWHNLDRALFDVTEGIRKAVEKITPNPPPPLPAPSVGTSIPMQEVNPSQTYPYFARNNQPPQKLQQVVSQNQVSISPDEKPMKPEGLKPYLKSLLIGCVAGSPCFVILLLISNTASILVAGLVAIIAGSLGSLIGGYIVGGIAIKRNMGFLVGTVAGMLSFAGLSIVSLGFYPLLLFGVSSVICCELLSFVGAWFARRKHP